MFGVEGVGGWVGRWRLDAPGRQLDAELVRLAPGAREAERVEEADVLLCVVEGGGLLQLPDGEQELLAGCVAFVGRGRRFAARGGPRGLAYVAVTRAGATGTAGGEAVCLLDRVCALCGRVSGERTARFCGGCGAELGSGPGAM